METLRGEERTEMRHGEETRGEKEMRKGNKRRGEEKKRKGAMMNLVFSKRWRETDAAVVPPH